MIIPRRGAVGLERAWMAPDMGRSRRFGRGIVPISHLPVLVVVEFNFRCAAWSRLRGWRSHQLRAQGRQVTVRGTSCFPGTVSGRSFEYNVSLPSRLDAARSSGGNDDSFTVARGAKAV